MINPSIMFLMDQINPTLNDVIIVGITGGLLWLALLLFAIIRHVQRTKSIGDAFARKAEIIIGIIGSLVFIGAIVMSLFVGYNGNETATWFVLIGFTIFAAFSSFYAVAEILFVITFYDDKVVWVNYFGIKRVYKYDEITDCFYGTKRGHLFVLFDFNNKKRFDMRMSDRLESTLKKRKIRISNAKDFR